MLSLHIEPDDYGYYCATDGRTYTRGYGPSVASATFAYMDNFSRNHRFIRNAVQWRNRKKIDLGHWAEDLAIFDELAPEVECYFERHGTPDDPTTTEVTETTGRATPG